MNVRFWRSIVILLALSAIASAIPLGCTGAARDDVAQFAQKFSIVWCHRVERCCEQFDYSTVDDCFAHVESIVDSFARANEDFDVEAGDDCVAEVQDNDDICVEPRAAAGSACLEVLDYIYSGSPDIGVEGTPCEGTCRRFGYGEELCTYLTEEDDPNATTCGVADGFYCNGDSMECEPVLDMGDTCSALEQCPETAYCKRDSEEEDGSCEPLEEEGGDCSVEQYACAPGFYCDLASEECRALKKEGASCSDDDECEGRCDGLDDGGRCYGYSPPTLDRLVGSSCFPFVED